MKQQTTVEEALRRAGRADMAELEERARQCLPKYLWTYKRGKEQWAYCSACRTDTRISRKDAIPDWVRDDPYTDMDIEAGHPEAEWGLRGPVFRTTWNGAPAWDDSGRHGHFGRCPRCGALAQYRSLNMGRKHVRDRAFLIRYAPDPIEDGALVMTGWLAMMDWGEWDELNEPEPCMDLTLREICLFRPDQGGERFVAEAVFTGDTEQTPDGQLRAVNVRRHLEWQRRQKCVGGFDPWRPLFGFQEGTRFYLDAEALDAAIGGTRWETPFRVLENCDGGGWCLDMIDLFSFIAQWPSVEYMAKLGFGGLLTAKLTGVDEHTINLRGKTAQKVLGVNGDDWGWIKGHPEKTTVSYLLTLHTARQKGLRLSAGTIGEACAKTTGLAVRRLLDSAAPERAAQALKWCLRHKVQPGDYADYLGQLEKLGLATNDKAVLYPADFAEAHERLSQRIRAERDRLADEKIARLLDGMGCWCFSALGLTIRPFVSSAEIIREGETMRHCVGGYVDRYADGGTILLALREDERPGKPWRTVEYTKDGALVQCRGYRNQSPEDEQPRIDAFFRLFDAYRAEYKRVNGKKTRRKAA